MPAAKKKSAAKTAPQTAPTKESRRYWLSYPPKLITRPIIWELAMKFPIVFNVRQASVSDEIGIMCLQLEGFRNDLKAAVAWLEKHGVRVEPVEINIIES